MFHIAGPKKTSTKFEKYGLVWPNSIHPAKVEMDMIRHGGQWERNGRTVGEGLASHMRKFQMIVWPEKVWHKWNTLQLEKYCISRSVAVLGPASSGKTNSAATDVLAEWWCTPEQMTGLFCSTTKERLEDRVWGELKKYFKLGKSRINWLDGYLIEGRQRVLLDARAEAVEGRDFRNGLIGVPCVTFGTLVDTPGGAVPVQDIKVGDVVLNAAGSGLVKEVHSRFAPEIIRVFLSDGRTVDCTPEHPWLTRRGWVDAIDLETLDTVYSAHETLQIMRKPTASGIPKQEVLQLGLSELSPRTDVRELQSTVPTMESEGRMDRENNGPILREVVCESVGLEQSFVSLLHHEAVLRLRKDHDWSPHESRVLLKGLQGTSRENAVRLLREMLHIHPRVPSQAQVSFLQRLLSMERDGQTATEGWNKPNAGGVDRVENVSGCCMEHAHKNWPPAEGRQAPLVQAGHSIPQSKAGCGDRREDSPDEEGRREGRKANGHPGQTWVDRVEILKPAGDWRFNQREGGYRVYNLSVSGHPSYSVNGVIVHNCKKGGDYVGLGDFIGIKNKKVRLIGDELQLLPKAFIESMSNLDKNPDFKILGMGNPKDTTDALGVLAEPSPELGGWESGLDQGTKTTFWATRRPGGVCIQFPGSDSPNLDGSMSIPLITKEQMDRDAVFYGRDSLWFTMFNEGRMPRGQGSRRVMTRQMCQKFGAFNEPVWADTNRTTIAFLDAAYRGVGGDRCVFGTLEFGTETTASEGEHPVSTIISQAAGVKKQNQVINLNGLRVVPIAAASQELPEDQIVKFVREQCTYLGIPPANFYYDSGMRTSLVSAFARQWSAESNPVDCGGKPSERSVSNDIKTMCRDYYFNFITELWFNVRMAVETGQFRGMTDDVCEEFSVREWRIVGNNKIQVEPKEDMKMKTGRSPDLADAVAMGIHGAIRRGFRLQKLRAVMGKRADDWRKEVQKKFQATWKAGSLNHKA